ncbi:unnamed protein product [Mytilus edulis]|uniref:ShKT domain-containing protein n=1 Tax=Mytilus edulis TaxID=6550 RepID=A0A8S3VGI9_MYTED|nr:unnamed protein product [Mytilus edulis]
MTVNSTAKNIFDNNIQAYTDVFWENLSGFAYSYFYQRQLSITKPTMSVAHTTSALTTTSKPQLTVFMTTKSETTAVNANNNTVSVLILTSIPSKVTSNLNIINTTVPAYSHLKVAYNKYGLSINKRQDNVHVGDTPSYTCTVQENANFLIGHPLRWGDGIKAEYDGYFVCALYDRNDVVLAKTKMEVNVIDYTARYCDDRSNDCSKVSNQCNDSTVKLICPSSCNICDGHHCNSTMTSSAISNKSVLSHPAGDYCSDGTQTNADSVVLYLCNARIDKMWQKSLQVVSNCQTISLYAPVSSFGSFSHQTGIFLGCTETGFKIGIQKCHEHFKEQTLVSGNTTTSFSNADVYFYSLSNKVYSVLIVKQVYFVHC